MTPSRWMDASSSPPIVLSSPIATWIVPATFSSSKVFPVTVAKGLIPIPSCAMFLALPLAFFTNSSSSAACLPPLKLTAFPSLTTILIGSSRSPNMLTDASKTNTPSAVTGEIYTSPAGKFPKSPGLRKMPSFVPHLRLPNSSFRFVPLPLSIPLF